MIKPHLVMPMGGRGARFSGAAFNRPKPLIEIHGKPFFYWSIQSIARFMEISDIIFVVLKEHVDNYFIDKEIYRYFPKAVIHVIPDVLNGAALTCMEGVKEICDKLPVIFNDCDHMFRCSAFEDFFKNNNAMTVDGTLLTFESENPKNSFLRCDESGYVLETMEKKAISGTAICGCYCFKDRDIFEAAAETYLDECHYKEFYLSGIYNIMAREGKLIKAFKTDFLVPFGVPEEYEEARNSKRFEELG